MLFRVFYTLDSSSSSARWAPLLGNEIRVHYPHSNRSGDLIICASSMDEVIDRMRWFKDVIAFGIHSLPETETVGGLERPDQLSSIRRSA